MLIELNISDFALIDNIRIDLKGGLNVLTGETGAGKSIIIDAVNMVLGERADTEVVRTGADKARVEALFDCAGLHGAIAVLQGLGIDMDGDKTLIISREIKAGRSISRLNGRMAALSSMRGVSRFLIDIHGQHQHQSLLDIANHIEVLDQFGGDGVLMQRKTVAADYERLQKLNRILRETKANETEREKNIDLYTYQVNEIETAGLRTDEDEELAQKREILINAENIFRNMAQSYELMLGSEGGMDSGIIDGLGQASHLIGAFSAMDDKLGGFYDAIESSRILLQEIARDIRDYLDALEFNPERLNEIEERLNIINGLKRKYGGTIEEIQKYRHKKAEELKKLKNTENEQQSLLQDIEKTKIKLERECELLSGLRKKAAIVLAGNITEVIVKLGMTKGVFEVCIEETEGFTHKGTDRVEFMFSANLGEPLKHLSKIVSGGEMSRIMLAIKTCLADIDRIPTLIFDEIDAGISGRTAQVVAQKLANVSKKHQVICVTHLPQIAAMADNHYLITKEEIDGHTYTRLKALDKEDRVLELARLLSGANITELTLKHSEEMLKMAKSFKNGIV